MDYSRGNGVEEGQSFGGIDAFLMSDERILWRAKPDKRVYILEAVFKMLPFVIIWVLFDGGFIAALKLSGALEQMPSFARVFIAVFFTIHLAPVWIWIWNIVRRSAEHKNIEYAATNKRFIVKSGFVNMDIRGIFFNEAANISLRVGRLDRLFQVGDILIKGVSVSVVMDDIKNPTESYRLLQNMAAELGDIKFPDRADFTIR